MAQTDFFQSYIKILYHQQVLLHILHVLNLLPASPFSKLMKCCFNGYLLLGEKKLLSKGKELLQAHG